MKGLNHHLRGLRDGLLDMSVDLAIYGGTRRAVGRIYVYWPFVTFRTPHRSFNITHAPTGYWIDDRRTKREAIDAIRALRQAADWEFTAPSGAKAKRAKAAARHLLPRRVHVA